MGWGSRPTETENTPLSTSFTEKWETSGLVVEDPRRVSLVPVSLGREDVLAYSWHIIYNVFIPHRPEFRCPLSFA